MTHRSYALILVASILGVAAALAAGSARLEPLSGDLSIGRYDEADFGWRGAQARFKKPLFQIVRPYRPRHRGPGRLVLNDGAASWVNYAAKETGARIATFHVRGKSWRALLDEPSYRAAPPKIFVLQIVERDLKKILGAASPACGGHTAALRVRLVSHPLTAAPERIDRPTRRTFAELDPRYFAQFQWARLLRRLGRSFGEVVEVSLTRRAFSSRRGDATLVYTGDVLKRFWTKADIEAMDCSLLQIQDAVQRDGRTLFPAMITPDKLTAYSPDLADRCSPPERSRRLDSARSPRPRRTRLEREILAGTQDIYLPTTFISLRRSGSRRRALLSELRRRGRCRPLRSVYRRRIDMIPAS